MDSTAWIELLTGSTLGGYRLDKCVGVGGFCLVFEVTKLDTGSRFAMKVLPPTTSPMAQVDFDNERTLLRKLNPCGSVVNLVDSASDVVPMTSVLGVTAPVPFNFHVLALASASLDEVTNSPVTLGRLSWPERLTLWRGAVKGVHQMHLKCVAHRDLKSSNCLIMVVGATSEVRLTDLVSR